MSKYFEVVYPRRLKELKEKLDLLAPKIINNPNEKEAESLVVEFWNEFSKFIENTKLHLASDSVKGQLLAMEEIRYVTPEYFASFFGDTTPTAIVFKALMKVKSQQTPNEKGENNGSDTAC